MTRLVMVEVKVVGNEDIVETRAQKWRCINEGQQLSEYRVNLAEGKKNRFLTVSGSVGKRLF